MSRTSGSAYAQRRALRRSWVWTIIAVGAGVFSFALLSRYGLLTRWRVEQQYRELRQRYEHLVQQADSLQHRIDQLLHDQREVERLAREQYGMARPGETVYVIPSEIAHP